MTVPNDSFYYRHGYLDARDKRPSLMLWMLDAVEQPNPDYWSGVLSSLWHIRLAMIDSLVSQHDMRDFIAYEEALYQRLRGVRVYFIPLKNRFRQFRMEKYDAS